MKKIIIIFLVLSILLSATSIAVSNENKNHQEIHKVTYSNPVIAQQYNNTFINQFECKSEFIKSGYYIVPKDTKQFYFPLETKITEVNVKPNKVSTIHLEKQLPITPHPVAFNRQNEPVIMKEKIEPETLNSWYDYRIGSGIIDNSRYLILTINIYPIKYNAEENLLLSAQNVDIKINYIAEPQTTSSETIYDLLIITPDEYKSALITLADHKIQNNISTTVITLESIYEGDYFPVQGEDEQENIKYFIKNAIEKWNITSVLLVGSAEKIPPRKTHIAVGSSDREVFVSDLYYADIYNSTQKFSSWDTNNNGIYAEFDWNEEADDLDLYPDVYIGRLACTNINEVTTAINKIITYENNKAYEQHWFSDIIVIGGDSFPGDKDQILEGEYVNEEIINIMDGFIPTRLWASNNMLSSANPNGVSIIKDTIDSGAGFVDFSGHGNTNVWATHPFEKDNVWIPTPFGQYLNSHIRSLENNNKLPIVITGACSVGKYDKDDDCFSWSFISNPNGGGIASFGSTGLGYAYTGKYVTYGLVEKMASDMFRAYQQNVKTVGEMWAYGIRNNINYRMDATELKTVEEWQLFGDPTLQIAAESVPPETPSITGKRNGRAGTEYQYEASSTDMDSSLLYYLFDWGDGSYSDWLGPYNQGQPITATHTWYEDGEYEVRVAVKDGQGVHSDWSEPFSISMPKKQIVDWQNTLINWIKQNLLIRYINGNFTSLFK